MKITVKKVSKQVNLSGFVDEYVSEMTFDPELG